MSTTEPSQYVATRSQPVSNSAHSTMLLQRKCSCGGSGASSISGECEACKKKRLQKKLSIGASNDPLEREADRIADQVMSMSPNSGVSRTPPRIQRATGFAAADAGTAPASVDRVLASSGRPLEPDLQKDMGRRFGYDFSEVRIHTGVEAEQSAHEVSAHAYTIGNNIVFGAGQFFPESNRGQRLLAHELTHVVQQSAMAATSIARSPTDPQGDPFAGTFSDDNSVVASTKLKALTPNELMERLVVAERSFQASPGGAPVNTPVGKGSALGPGYRTYAGVQIIDKEGNQVISAIGRYVGGGKAHAEVDAVNKLLAAIEELKIDVRGMRMMVVVDQTVCQNCTSALESFATNKSVGIEQMDVYLTSRPGSSVTPKTASRTAAKVGAEAKLSFSKKFPATSEPGNTAESTGPGSKAPGQTSGKAESTQAGKSTPGEHTPADTNAPGKANKPSAPTETKAPVETEISVVSSVEKPGGQTITELEVTFGKGLDTVNANAPAGNGLPSKIGIRITQNADGDLVSAESTTGQPAAFADALAEQILRSGAGPSAGSTAPPSEVLGDVGSGTEGASGGAAVGVSRALSIVSKGVKWGGTAAFVVITGYRLITAKPEQRPRIVAQAAGTVVGSAVGSYLVCNALLDIETAGWGLLICGIVAGGAGGYAGSKAAGAAYDAATMTDLDRALRKLSKQPRNVRRLFYSLVVKAGAAGIPITSEFVNRFIGVVPQDLTDSELIILAGQLHPNVLDKVATNMSAAIASIKRAVESLPGRGPLGSILIDTPKHSIDLRLHATYNVESKSPGISFGPMGAGRVTILPGFGKQPIAVPPGLSPTSNVVPLLQIDLDNPKKR